MKNLKGGEVPHIVSHDSKKLVAKAVWLSWFTIIYNVIEGFVSIGFGVSGESVALFGFGMDSFVEVASAILVLWRFRGEIQLSGPLSIDRERKATHKIGVLFIVLALVTMLASVIRIFEKEAPDTTLPGFIIALFSLSFMYFLWSSKRKVGTSLNSSTIVNDAACSMACIKLSFVLLLGSLIYLIAPSLWWIDSVAALVIAAFIFKEGREIISSTKKEGFSGGCCGCD